MMKKIIIRFNNENNYDTKLFIIYVKTYYSKVGPHVFGAFHGGLYYLIYAPTYRLMQCT